MPPKDCRKCLIDNPKHVAKEKSNGLCKRHNKMFDDPSCIVICRVCKDTYDDNPGYNIVGKYCKKHRDVKHVKKCVECVRLQVENPKAVQRNDLCVAHGGANLCKKCIELKVENPKQISSNGLCREHGAEKKMCKKCLELKVKNPKEVQKNNLCLKHGAPVPLCKKCLELKVNKPSRARVKQLCQKHITESCDSN